MTLFIPVIIVLVILLTLLTEGLTWVFVYRTVAYKSLINSIERSAKENGGKPGAPAKDNKAEKTKRKLDRAAKTSAAQMWGFKVKGGIIQGVVLFSAWWILSSQFVGQPMGRLPFDSPLLRVTHHKLEGDLRLVSFNFIYMLCQAGVRVNVVKLLGFGPTRQVAALTEMSQLVPKQ